MSITLNAASLAAIADLIREAGSPLHINRLAPIAVRLWLESQAGQRAYAPGAIYAEGEVVQFHGRSARVIAVQPGDNPKQGKFHIVTLRFEDDSQKRVAAAIDGAPDAEHVEISDARVQAMLDDDGWRIRVAIQEALDEDGRFCTFRNEQGDFWCLTKILPAISRRELAQVWAIIRSQAGAESLAPLSTGSLMRRIWQLENDGSMEYQLFEFALNVTLAQFDELRYVAAAGWVMESAWRKLGERPSLIGPRMATEVPAAMDSEDEEEDTPGRGNIVTEEEMESQPVVADVESWRSQRREQVTITLHPNHYYNHWLPLRGLMQWLLPPWDCQVTLHFHLDGNTGSCIAWVDPEQKKVLAGRELYDAFANSGVYPGARLVFSHRGSDYEYDVRTVPFEGEQPVTVRRIGLTDGELEVWDDEEPLRYQVDGDVFVASARWEDLRALFRQAEEAGNSIFGLMYKVCQRWQKVRGEPLIVTADELFQKVHRDYRMTSKATIAYELWRRRAFEPVGQGRYRFQPEKGEGVRNYGLSGRRARPLTQTARAGQPRKNSLAQMVGQTSQPPIGEGEQLPAVVSPPELAELSVSATRDRQLEIPDSVPVGPLFAESKSPVAFAQPATGYFIFQQRPDSEYDDRTGQVYNWRQGIPGSKQIQPGACFIYYRPGEQVFFGAGRIEWIESYVGGDGVIYYDGQIADYVAWKPPLPLTWALMDRLSFSYGKVLGIGQAGIRKINREDFETIWHAYQQHHTFPMNRIEATERPLAEPTTTAASVSKQWEQVQALVNQTLRTIVKKQPFHIYEVSPDAIYFENEETGEKRQIPRHIFEDAVQRIELLGRLSRNELNELYYEAHPKYLAAILDALPGIRSLLETPASGERTTSEPNEFSQMQMLIQAELIGNTIYTPGGQANRIVMADENGLTVATRSGEDQIPWAWIKGVYDVLRQLGAIERKDVQEGEHKVRGGFRSAFIFGLLARFGHVMAQTEPRAHLVYRPPQGGIRLKPVGFAPALQTEAETDGVVPDRAPSANSE